MEVEARTGSGFTAGAELVVGRGVLMSGGYDRRRARGIRGTCVRAMS
jgi:hypothetical protein